jgi:hypothetical protein
MIWAAGYLLISCIIAVIVLILYYKEECNFKEIDIILVSLFIVFWVLIPIVMFMTRRNR